MTGLLKQFVGSKNDRDLRRLLPLVERANRLEPALMKLPDAALQARSGEFRQRLAQGEAPLALIPESFAVVREAMKRTIGKRLFDVQLLGGAVLHEGRIAEMKTGEGKTFVATLPCYLNALTGRGVHVVTVNDYLARRDAEWMGAIHRFLGLSVGCILSDLSEEERKNSYACDITYGTNNEFGFDYLRDNMKPAAELCVQRELHYAIVDEVDSILIDEARTPLIISGPSEQNTEIYRIANQVIPRLSRGQKADPKTGAPESGDYWVDEEHRTTALSEEGVHKVEQLLRVENLYDPQMLPVLHAVNQALSAHALKRRDVDYVVQPGEERRLEVVIVDEFTGRLMKGRRWSDGLHQAVEAKEGIPVQSESQTYASVTFQNYFRMYEKLAGMTGTADTEAPEFAKIYDLDVLVVPTNRPMLRADLPDVVFKSEREKFGAVIEDIAERHERGQPVLVGTISIENSERLSKLLAKRGVRHNVLNAKQHAREAQIVAQAGRRGAVTISTNMAGRGTDIVLGGSAEQLALDRCGGDRQHDNYARFLADFESRCAAERSEVVAAGGLHILGTERHESRRIDNQLRGRSGRQGDPGSSQFYLSLEDDLLRIFGSERMQPWMERLGLQEGEAIESRMLTRQIENAQRKVEARNFDTRKHLLDYDNVMNLQRRTFYGKRREILAREDLHEEILEITESVLVDALGDYWPEKSEPGPQQLAALATALTAQFGVAFHPEEPPFLESGRPARDKDELGRAVLERLRDFLSQKRSACDELAEQHSEVGYPSFARLEREILLSVADRQWKDHLHAMDGLREGVSLRGYAQRDPKIEYQREGFGLFEQMNRRVDAEVAQLLFRLPLPGAETIPARLPAPAAPALPGLPRGATGRTPRRAGRVGRNDPCPCGSGKKFKKCCGAAAAPR
ncbi:MAG: preprotein translocase subunit SecA [Deltaproteobacteria bacterium]|nr:preprotein translocase subunit SecA [Deltaproteobacteria bacterium]